MPLLHINRYFEEVEVGLVAVINRRPVLVGKLNLAELAIDALMPRPALVQVQLPTYYRLAILPRDYGAERLLQAEAKTSLAILPRRSLSKAASPKNKPPSERGLSENPTGGVLRASPYYFISTLTLKNLMPSRLEGDISVQPSSVRFVLPISV